VQADRLMRHATILEMNIEGHPIRASERRDNFEIDTIPDRDREAIKARDAVGTMNSSAANNHCRPSKPT
jgi:hypothetical protein